MTDDSSTRRMSPDEMERVQAALDGTGVEELTVTVTADVLPRISALLTLLETGESGSDELEYAMALRQIFMTGLYTLESELAE